MPRTVYVAEPERGDCYNAAFVLVGLMGVENFMGERWFLCHGWPVLSRGPFAGRRHGHAWVELEVGGRVIYIDAESCCGFSREFAYAYGKIDARHVVRRDADAALAMFAKTGRVGPWLDVDGEPYPDALFYRTDRADADEEEGAP